MRQVDNNLAEHRQYDGNPLVCDFTKPIVASKVINSDPNYHAGEVPDFQLILEIPSVIFDLTTNKVLECPVWYLSSYFS